MKSTNPDQSPRDISLKCLTPRKLILSRFEKHIATAVAAVAIGTAAPASAVVAYSGLINFSCAVDIDGAYLNVETGMLSNGPGGGVPGWDVNPYSTSGGMNFFNSTGGGQMRRPGVTTGTAGNLVPGTEVGAAGSFNTGTGNVYGTTAATGLNGGWTLGAQNIIGFKFVAAAGTTHYGWMRFDMGLAGSAGTSMTRTLKDYSWETTPGASIFVTAGAPDEVPEPTSMLYTLLTLSSGLLLRRRGKVSV
jgi:hypothetical protein